MGEKDNILEQMEDRRKENPFQVPEGYFDTLHARIQDRIQNENVSSFTKVVRILRSQLALGVYLVLFAAVAYGIIAIVLPQAQDNSLPSSDYARTMEVDAFEYSEQHFIDVLLEEETTKEEEQKAKETEYYIHYLVDEDIDYGTLIDEL